jgi:hypothetical protein
VFAFTSSAASVSTTCSRGTGRSWRCEHQW